MHQFLLYLTISLWIVSGLFYRALGQGLLLTNGYFIDPEKEEIIQGHLWVQADTVIQLLRNIPESFEGEQVDLGKSYVLPGLYDMHTHSWGNMAPGGLADILSTDGTAKRMLYAGVTGFLDLFSPEEYILNLRDQQRANPSAVPGANIHCAGPIFTCTGGHGTEYGVPTRIIDNPEDAFREMKELAPAKPDVIKIMYNRNPTYLPSMDKETMQAIIQAAHNYGFKVVSHINTWEDIADLVEAGIDGFTHTPRGKGPQDLLKQIKEKGIVCIPTLSVHLGLLTLIQQPSLLREPILFNGTLEGVATAYLDTTKFTHRDRGWLRYQEENKDSISTAFIQLASSGIPILTGTDSGNLGTFQGASLHIELLLMQQLGIDKWKILKSSSVLAPQWLGIKTGYQSGAQASFLVLEDSPLSTLDNLKNIRRLLHRGEWIERNSLVKNSSLIID